MLPLKTNGLHHGTVPLQHRLGSDARPSSYPTASALTRYSASMEDLMDLILRDKSPEECKLILADLVGRLRRQGHPIPDVTSTPYLNTIPPEEEPEYPGDLEMERLIRSHIRWNAMAMVVRANLEERALGVGGHIATYASLATLYEVGYNHFFRGDAGGRVGDMIYFQGHASPGNYSRAFMEYRLHEAHLENFRQELQEHPGLSSYPHPYLMPDFWQFPTVSMGLGPIHSIYQARFSRYLQHRGLLEVDREEEPRIWCFIGDGESDEPETLGQLNVASREGLDNLVWVINCNLQRLDGPVRGNAKIIQELEGVFRGAGWNVIKLVWGSDWDDLLKKDESGLLARRMEEVVDGEYQQYVVQPGSYIRRHFFGKYPELLRLVDHLSDDQLKRLHRGGHDPKKIYAAYHRAVHQRNGRPTVILAKTVKGYGLGEAGEARNPTHQQKKLGEKDLRHFARRFNVPLSDPDVAEMPFFRPPKDSAEIRYLLERREKLDGFVPKRSPDAPRLEVPAPSEFGAVMKATVLQKASTTKAYTVLLSALLRHRDIGRFIVPIVPDEARTFGMEGLFKQIGIYSSKGQLYTPVDKTELAPYIESKSGQLLEEGINEAGSMGSFVAAGTAYFNYKLPTIPFYIYYSMFGFQRVGDQIWLAGDSRARGFLLGATSGRTSLNGEGLQHQDAHSHLAASGVPNLMAYEPAYGYELAIILCEGLRRMHVEGEDVFYYVSLHNDDYKHSAFPEDRAEEVTRGVLKGMYLAHPSDKDLPLRAQILGSGAILMQALQAQSLLEDYGVAADVWSVTSFKHLRTEALEADRWNRLHPTAPPRSSYLAESIAGHEGPWVAVSDNLKLVADQIAPWIPGGLTTLGCDGFGRSDARKTLRRFFEVDGPCTAVATLHALARQGKIPMSLVEKAIQDLGVDPEKAHAVCL